VNGRTQEHERFTGPGYLANSAGQESTRGRGWPWASSWLPTVLPSVISVGPVGPCGSAPFASNVLQPDDAEVEAGKLEGWAPVERHLLRCAAPRRTVVQEEITQRVDADAAVERLVDVPGLLRDEELARSTRTHLWRLLVGGRASLAEPAPSGGGAPS